MPPHETQELGFASRLPEVPDEQGLEQLPGDVFLTAGSAAGRFARSETGYDGFVRPHSGGFMYGV